MLTELLVVAAFVAGLAGTWSPCGMSMICTLAPEDHEHGRAAALAAAVVMTLGCILGGTTLFVGLALAGGAISVGGLGPALVAGAVGITAAGLDAAGVRVLPQIRNQVPESWRRRAPLWAASGGYGVLLGLGFTTFVMSYTLWAVAVLSLLIGSPALGVAVGIGFGVGRALPIAALAPWSDRRWALAIQESMSQRPATLRTVRIVAACLVCAGAIGAATSPALASSSVRLVAYGMDPSVDGTQLAFRKAGGPAPVLLLRDLRQDPPTPISGRLHAVGGGLVARLDQEVISVGPPGDVPPLLTFAAPPGVDALAVSDQWVAYRVAASPIAGRPFEQIVVRRVDGSDMPRTIAGVSPPTELGRPALSHGTLAYHVASTKRSRISVVDLQTGQLTAIKRVGAQVLFPALADGAIAFVEVTSCTQKLLLQQGTVVRVLASRFTSVRRDTGFADGAKRVSRFPMHCEGPRGMPAGRSLFWQTALTDAAAYLTIIDAGAPRGQPRILEVPR